MACRGCGRRRNPGSGGSKRLTARVPGEPVKLRYLGDSNELVTFVGAATRTEYVVGGRVNLVDAYSSDLATGISWAPGLLEITGEGGKKLFEVHVPLKEELEAEARAQKAREAAETLALKPKRRKAKLKAETVDGESPLPGD